jgi:hypothetical protein
VEDLKYTDFSINIKTQVIRVDLDFLTLEIKQIQNLHQLKLIQKIKQAKKIFG